MGIPNRSIPQPNRRSREPGDVDPVLDIPAWVHALPEPDRGYMLEICRRALLFRNRCRDANTSAMRRIYISAARQRFAA